MRSAEDFGGTIEAYTYPDEFKPCIGESEIVAGVNFGQQKRQAFGFVCRTTVGNDVQLNDYGYKLHLVYNATCSPSSRDHETINDSPDAETMSWDFETTPVNVGNLDGTEYKPTSHIVLDSRDFTSEGDIAILKTIEDALYGTNSTDPYLPKPAQVYALLTSAASTYNVTLNPTGGTITSGDITSYTTGTAVPFTSVVVTKEDMDLVGWIEANGSGDIVTGIPADAVGDKVYNAVWKVHQT